MYKCEVCAKTFTGRVSYDQHQVSDKHKRKVLASNLLNTNDATGNVMNNPTESTCNNIKCEVCDISFNSFENFQHHVVTPEHALKIMMSKTEESSNCDVSSSSNVWNNVELNHKEAKSIDDDDDDDLLPGFNDKKFQNLSFGSCTVCNKTFSGPEPYKQHLASALHKKKVEMQKNPFSATINPNNTSFSCEPCKKAFSGQVPYIQHMNSEVHKKKLQQINDTQKFLSELDSPLKMEESDTKMIGSENALWFCKICNKQCSGQVPYQQHISGSTHFKNMKRMELPNFTLENSTIQKSNYNENKITEKSECMSQFSTVIQNNQTHYQQVVDDQILLEKIEGLKVMSTDELEASIKVFVPDEKIDFDIVENKMLIDLTNGNISHDDSNNIETEKKIKEVSEKTDTDEAKENSDVYQVCNLCDVKLFNKEEAVSHYESIEHFNKRWHSN